MPNQGAVGGVAPTSLIADPPADHPWQHTRYQDACADQALAPGIVQDHQRHHKGWQERKSGIARKIGQPNKNPAHHQPQPVRIPLEIKIEHPERKQAQEDK